MQRREAEVEQAADQSVRGDADYETNPQRGEVDSAKGPSVPPDWRKVRVVKRGRRGERLAHVQPVCVLNAKRRRRLSSGEQAAQTRAEAR